MITSVSSWSWSCLSQARWWPTCWTGGELDRFDPWRADHCVALVVPHPGEVNFVHAWDWNDIDFKELSSKRWKGKNLVWFWASGLLYTVNIRFPCYKGGSVWPGTFENQAWQFWLDPHPPPPNFGSLVDLAKKLHKWDRPESIKSTYSEDENEIC